MERTYNIICMERTYASPFIFLKEGPYSYFKINIAMGDY